MTIRMLVSVLAALSLASASAHAQVVVSQASGAGGFGGVAPRADFVELYNRGGTPQDLTGWSVQCSYNTTVAWVVIPLPSFTLQPGQYFLIQAYATAGATGTPLPTPDVVFSGTSTTILFSNEGGVALCNSTTQLSNASCPVGDPQIVDFVHWGGTAACFDGSGRAPATASPGYTIFRLGDGCIDTNDNAADFTTNSNAVCNPRNSSSPFNPGAGTPGATASASPAVVNAGNSTTFTAQVSACGGSPLPLSSLTGDFTAFGLGAAVPFAGSPTTWTYTLNVPPTQASGVYIIPLAAADGASNYTGSTSIRVIGPPPSNDTCAGAIEFTSTPYTSPLVTYSTATEDLDANPTCDAAANAGARYGVWWKFTPQYSGSLALSRVSPSGEDTVTSVWTGSCGSLAQVSCTDADAAAFNVPMTGGTTYYILVSKYAATVLSAFVDVGISANFTISTGACCNGASCTATTPPDCTGFWIGANTSCAGGPQASESPAVGIPDAVDNVSVGTVVRTLELTGPGTVTDIAVTVGILHTFVGDVRIHLGAPNGAQTDLLARPAGSTAAPTCPVLYGIGNGNDLNGVYTFTDSAPTGVNAAALANTVLPSGSYRAQNCDNTIFDLNSIFAGSPIAGTWTLTVTDEDGAIVGTLNSWSITINGGTEPPCGLVGSCCVGAACSIVTSGAACAGSFTLGTTTCTPTTCGPASGVCCRGATCNTSVSQANCTGGALAGASFAPAAASCNATGSTTTPCCYADYNKVNGLEIQDI
ncbi:MAG TPA: proprotein convertase P-domain-containing protein, partial [Phycisphaerales bacterium]|nr:proprotein convertase P-domain-containing protein [Phycisphaerales bacterium]